MVPPQQQGKVKFDTFITEGAESFLLHYQANHVMHK